MSRKKRQVLADSEEDEHRIVFFEGEMIEIICPKASAKDVSADEA